MQLEKPETRSNLSVTSAGTSASVTAKNRANWSQ